LGAGGRRKACNGGGEEVVEGRKATMDEVQSLARDNGTAMVVVV